MKYSRDLFQHLVNGYCLKAAILLAGRFLSVIDRYTGAARKVCVEVFMPVPHGAVEPRGFGAEENHRWQLKQGGKMSRAAVIGNHDFGDRV